MAKSFPPSRPVRPTWGSYDELRGRMPIENVPLNIFWTSEHVDALTHRGGRTYLVGQESITRAWGAMTRCHDYGEAPPWLEPCGFVSLSY